MTICVLPAWFGDETKRPSYPSVRCCISSDLSVDRIYILSTIVPSAFKVHKSKAVQRMLMNPECYRMPTTVVGAIPNSWTMALTIKICSMVGRDQMRPRGSDKLSRVHQETKDRPKTCI